MRRTSSPADRNSVRSAAPSATTSDATQHKMSATIVSDSVLPPSATPTHPDRKRKYGHLAARHGGNSSVAAVRPLSAIVLGRKKARISTLSAIDRERKWFGSGGFEMSAVVSERVPPLATPTRRPETVVVTARHVNRAVARRRRQSVSVEIPETRIASFDYRISTTDRPTDRPETEVVRQDVGDGEREESDSSGALHAIVERRADATSRHDDHVHRVTDDTHNTQRTAAQEQTGTGRMCVVIRV